MMLLPPKEVHFDFSEVVVADEVKVGKEEEREEKDWMMEKVIKEVTAKKMEIDEEVTEEVDEDCMTNKKAEKHLNINNEKSTTSVGSGHFKRLLTPLFGNTTPFASQPKLTNSAKSNSAAFTTAKTVVAVVAPVTIPRSSYHHSSLKRPLSAHDSGLRVELDSASCLAKPAPSSRAVPAVAGAKRSDKRKSNNNNNNNNNNNQITGPPAKCLGLFCPQVTKKDSCRNSFTDKLTLEAHLVAEHGGRPTKKCPAPDCTRLYRTNEQILLHFGKAHRGTVHTLHCQQCTRPMAFPVDFRKEERCLVDLLVFIEHQKFAHEQGVFQCGQAGCRFLAAYRSSVERHYFLKHHKSEGKRAMMQEKEN